ncbi:Transposable element Tc3 transposase, partial [Dictyocoela muelleri]
MNYFPEERDESIEETRTLETGETSSRTGRKTRQPLTKNIIECFLNLKRSLMSFTNMIPILQISKSALKRLNNRYLAGELQDLSQFKSAGEKKSCITKDISFEKNFIATEFELNPCSRLTDISEKLKEINESGSYSQPTICRIVKKMGYTRKSLTLVPLNRNSDENKNVRALFASSLVSINDNQIIYVDETGFNLHSYQNMGYSPINTKCFITVPNSKGVNISVLCAITTLGVLAFKIKVGSFKSDDVLEFITTQLPILQPNASKFIVMDNATIHRTAVVKVSLREKNYILKFLPPYTPQLNPIEEFFSCLKSHVRQNGIFTDRSVLIGVIQNV